MSFRVTLSQPAARPLRKLPKYVRNRVAIGLRVVGKVRSSLDEDRERPG
jgi:hypothetical protein